MTHSDTGTGSKRGLGQELKDTRLQRGLSQAKLAVILKVSEAAISRWEHGITGVPEWNTRSRYNVGYSR
jgi:transcriptional regulator with XRE-family HTH domain